MRRNSLVVWLAVFAIIIISLSCLSQDGDTEPEGLIINPPGSSILNVKIWTDKSRYLPEEEIEIHYELGNESYFYIYNVDPGGEVRLLFPNRYDQDNLLEAGKGKLPGKGYSFLTGKTEGKEYFQAIASKEELSIFPTPSDEAPQGALFPKLSNSPEKFGETTTQRIKEAKDAGYWMVDWTTVEVTQRTSKLSITSSPTNAKIYVDQRYVGRTPNAVDVKPGNRKVKLLMGSDLRWSREIYVKPNQVKSIRGRLQRIRYSTVSVSSTPPRAEIYVDGEYVGETPRRVRVEAGEMTLELKKEGYRTWEKVLQLAPKQSRWIDVDLSSASRVESPPNLDLSFGVGVNTGGFLRQPFSFGLEFTFNQFVLGGSLGDTEASNLPQINWKEETYYGGEMNCGPEWEIYFGYLLDIVQGLSLRMGAGLAVQPRAKFEQLGSVASSTGINTMASVARNAELVTQTNPTLHGGVQVKRDGYSLSLTYHSRRGPVLGFGYRF